MCSGLGVSGQGQSSMVGLKVYGEDRGSGAVAREPHVTEVSVYPGLGPVSRSERGSIRGF